MNKLFFANLKEGTPLFKRFRLEQCLSAGDNSGVYLCKDAFKEDNSLVLKVTSTNGLEDSVPGKRFCNEIMACARIEHPNVLRCQSFYQDDMFTAFAMEYLSSGTLADLIQKRGCLSIPELVRISLEVFAGLEAIHDAGIIHRDLKPENIMIAADGTAKIGDFGIAAKADLIVLEAHEALTGTINYLSPEYIEYGVFDERSDIHGLGLIMFEMITGTLPFMEGSPLERMTKRVKQDPPHPDTLRKECPVWLSKIVMKAIARDPNDRFQSASEFLRALRLVKLRREQSDKTKRDGGKTKLRISATRGKLSAIASA